MEAEVRQNGALEDEGKLDTKPLKNRIMPRFHQTNTLQNITGKPQNLEIRYIFHYFRARSDQENCVSFLALLEII